MDATTGDDMLVMNGLLYRVRYQSVMVRDYAEAYAE